MVARLQQLIAFTLIIAASGWGSYFAMRGHVQVAIAGSALLLFSHVFFLATQFLLLAVVDPSPVSTPRRRHLFRAWWREALTSPRVFFWRQPFRSNSIPDFLMPERLGGRGVVLVHGLACNRGFWNPWMKKLRQRQIPFIAVNLEPPFSSIDDYQKIIDDAVCRMQKATGIAPVVVAHSMGGLAVRLWISRCGDAQNVVHQVVTIGTPHAGTWLARYSYAANGMQMRLGSPWLQRLAGSEPDSLYRRFTCFYSDCDNVVFPMRTATLPGADNRRVDGAPHVGMAYEPLVFKEVLRLLTRP